MGRQLFLHHYLPAHLASALVTGALLEFVCCTDPVSLDESSSLLNADSKPSMKKGSTLQKRRLTSKERLHGQSLLYLWAAAGAILALAIGGWYFFLPLTYGKPGLDVRGVNARKWLGYDLHFAK